MASKKLAKKVYKVFVSKKLSPVFDSVISKNVSSKFSHLGDKEGLKAQGFCQEWSERCAGGDYFLKKSVLQKWHHFN